MEIPFNDLRTFNNEVIIVNSPCSNSMITKQPADNNLPSHKSLSTGKEYTSLPKWTFWSSWQLYYMF